MKLAINGGAALRTTPFPAWPVYDDTERDALIEVLESRTWGTLGPRVHQLEKRFADFAGAAYAQSVFNGTVALETVLRALGIGPGDEVIVPPYTFVATVSSVLMAGATPIFADIDPRTNCVDPQKVDAAITPRTRAVIPVHMAGMPADMDSLTQIGKRHGIAVVEDAAQAHGAEWRGRKVGSIGDAGTFSFQLSKNMTAGEGGMITTNDETLLKTCWSIHHCGRRPSGAWYEHERAGSNFRMTEWQAAILIAQMARIEEQMATREERAGLLDKLLSQIPGITLFERDPRVTRHSHHLYMFKYHSHDFKGISKARFLKALNSEGIPSSSGYVELNKQALFRDPQVKRILSRPIDYASLELPQTARACEETIWIPQNVLLAAAKDIEDIARAVDKIRQFCEEMIVS
ncbi:MAG TPA: DegT/DnrJ/EryC1/StrS family aminotransferase [Spirochaetia bacterium]|nr:DegT/DnrJ/EryC1/StrS family aminotransferase [Spirochaetia bacterium]